MKARLRYSKLGKLRFLSHRDLARLWERSLRRAGVPVAYSEGFSPRPRLHFGLALSTGHEGLAEYLDVDLTPEAEIAVEDLPALVNAVLPDGIAALGAVPVEPGTPSLQQAVSSCSWQLEVVGATPDAAAAAIARVLAADALPIRVERKGAEVDLDARPAIVALEPAGPSGPPPGVAVIRPSTVLVAELATQSRSLRPAELVRALDPG
ncbi:MAG TPA: TIGR03936 family radical SAM-associated protein, partial [Acidimicrobiales bacterium]|nr:TIGR03936 family radical SAM-associated protein [Acidimicrobiales bacterium]